MKLVDVASMVLPYVCPLVHPSLPSLYHRIRAFLASIPRLSSLFLSSLIPNVPIFRLDSADSLHLFLSSSLPFSLSRANISPTAASSFDRIEESSETAAISAEIESQNGENDCECFPPCRRGSVKERGCTGAKEDLRRSERRKRERERRKRTEGEQVEVYSTARSRLIYPSSNQLPPLDARRYSRAYGPHYRIESIRDITKANGSRYQRSAYFSESFSLSFTRYHESESLPRTAEARLRDLSIILKFSISEIMLNGS